MGLHNRGIVIWLLVALVVIFTGVQICVTNFNQDLGQQQSVAVLAVKQTTDSSWQVNIMNHTVNIDAAPIVQRSKSLLAEGDSKWGNFLLWAKGECGMVMEKLSHWWQVLVNR